jgi:hypothetical protein
MGKFTPCGNRAAGFYQRAFAWLTGCAIMPEGEHA